MENLRKSPYCQIITLKRERVNGYEFYGLESPFLGAGRLKSGCCVLGVTAKSVDNAGSNGGFNYLVSYCTENIGQNHQDWKTKISKIIRKMNHRFDQNRELNEVEPIGGFPEIDKNS